MPGCEEDHATCAALLCMMITVLVIYMETYDTPTYDPCLLVATFGCFRTVLDRFSKIDCGSHGVITAMSHIDFHTEIESYVH